MTWPDDLVVEALRAPQTLAGWSNARWSALFRQARAAGLLGRVTRPVEAASPWPNAAQGHVDAARRLGLAQQTEIRRELKFIESALADLHAPIVLLKGAAYVAADLPPAQGRVFSDIDLMVPKAALARSESSLMVAGWMTTHHSAYDQRYYREWMHELPPMQHVQRQTTIDLHHTILPETCRLRPDPRMLFDKAVALPGHPGFHVLCPADMVLHSMTHLFMNDDMSHALRDLSDIDLLLRHFALDAGFWPELTTRARALNLQRPLFYGLHHAAAVLGTPVPSGALAEAERSAPPAPVRPLMNAIWRRALRTPHHDARPPLAGAALFALYLRGHWLRMPPALLARHLTIKALGLHRRAEAPKSPDTPG